MPSTAVTRVGHDSIPALQSSNGRRLVLLCVCLALGFSSSRFLRFEFSGLLFQPILIPAVVLYLMGAATVWARLPRAIRTSLSVFIGLYVVTSLIGGFDLGDLTKAAMFLIVLVAVAGSIEEPEDARAAALGFAVSMGLVGLSALAAGGVDEDAVGINPLGGVSNANGYSVYALPAILIAGYFLLEATTPFRSRVILAVSSLACTAAVLSTPNRSGFLGLAVIVVLLLARGRRLRDVVALVLLASTFYFGFLTFGDTSALDAEFGERRSSESTYTSGTDLRVALVEESFAIGLRNPILGVGVQNVPSAIGSNLYERGEVRYPYIDAHNVVGDIVAGGGLTLLLAFVVFGWALWTRPQEWTRFGRPSPDERSARGLVRIVMVLFLVRGMFTGDVITIPSFAVALGISVGWMIANRPRSDAADVEVAAEPSRQRRAMSAAAPPHVDDPQPLRFSHNRRLVDFDPWSPR